MEHRRGQTILGFCGIAGPAVFVVLVTVAGALHTAYEDRLLRAELDGYEDYAARKGPWRHLEAAELSTLEWVDWFNTRRLLEPIGYVPPAEYEAGYYERAAVG